MTDSPATVLVVDDEPAIRRFLKSTLEVQGWAMVEAVDGGEATRAVRHHRPEIILLDLGLPDRDGMALLPELEQLSDAAILVLTSRDDERSMVAALDGGADDYVTKPFSIPELLARMRTALRHRVQEQGGRPDGAGGRAHHRPRPSPRHPRRPGDQALAQGMGHTGAAGDPRRPGGHPRPDPGQGMGPRHEFSPAISLGIAAGQPSQADL